MNLEQIKCQSCSISRLCLPVMLADAEIEHLDSIVKRRKPYQKDDVLFRYGDPLESLYAVRSGCLKTYTLDSDGTEQITGFYLPGEIIGLDAIADNTHQSFAKALDTSLVCALPYNKLDILAGQIPGLRSQLLKIMSNEIQDDKALFLLLNKKNSEQRLAAFIINLSRRYANRGLASDRFQLPMTQVDIANYLGMAVETISRLFKKLNKLELLELKQKEINIINMQQLSQFAGTSCHVN
ncbi:MAG: fumarate/nitrate reduction transcriptional regulator Fnr [Gammaproteobacteria bacterium]|nr:fumarate/nitrate reduction transcriptional regulator Fnr [Gammaproteobacteria bacterium]